MWAEAAEPTAPAQAFRNEGLTDPWAATDPENLRGLSSVQRHRADRLLRGRARAERGRENLRLQSLTQRFRVGQRAHCFMARIK